MLIVGRTNPPVHPGAVSNRLRLMDGLERGRYYSVQRILPVYRNRVQIECASHSWHHPFLQFYDRFKYHWLQRITATLHWLALQCHQRGCPGECSYRLIWGLSRWDLRWRSSPKADLVARAYWVYCTVVAVSQDSAPPQHRLIFTSKTRFLRKALLQEAISNVFAVIAHIPISDNSGLSRQHLLR